MVLLAVSISAAVVVVVSGAKGELPSPAFEGDKQPVLRVVRQGQAAVLHEKPAMVCSLLTRRARRNSLRLFNLDQYQGGRPRPKPTNCVEAIGYQIDDARRSGDLRYLRKGGYLHKTSIVRIEGRRAHIHKGAPNAGTEIFLRRTSKGWLGDYASLAPFDGSSGY